MLFSTRGLEPEHVQHLLNYPRGNLVVYSCSLNYSKEYFFKKHTDCRVPTKQQITVCSLHKSLLKIGDFMSCVNLLWGNTL